MPESNVLRHPEDRAVSYLLPHLFPQSPELRADCHGVGYNTAFSDVSPGLPRTGRCLPASGASLLCLG